MISEGVWDESKWSAILECGVCKRFNRYSDRVPSHWMIVCSPLKLPVGPCNPSDPVAIQRFVVCGESCRQSLMKALSEQG
jgi:hypothetical protein